jgi:hypothetical protein
MRLHAITAAWMMLLGAMLLGVASATAAVRIDGDAGGRIDEYLSRYEALRSTGERVIVDGPCNSACTLLLGKLPRSRICVTSRASLGFHAAWTPDQMGRPMSSPAWTRVLWSNYPQHIRHWISRHGGLTPRMIYLRGNQLNSMYPHCGSDHGFEAFR